MLTCCNGFCVNCSKDERISKEHPDGSNHSESIDRVQPSVRSFTSKHKFNVGVCRKTDKGNFKSLQTCYKQNNNLVNSS